MLAITLQACTTSMPITPPAPRGANQGGPQIPRIGRESEAATLALETITPLQAGGSVEASRHGGDCRGFVGSEPNFRVSLEDTRSTRFMAQGDRDLTLAVLGPSGQHWCNDDYDGLNPMVELAGPIPGVYAIYVGTYASDRSPANALVTRDLSRMPSQLMGQTITVPLNHEVESSSGLNAPAVGEPCSIEQDLSDPASTRWRVACSGRIFYSGALPPNDPSWPTGTIAYDAQMSSGDQTPTFNWNTEGIFLRDDNAGALGELEIRLRPRTIPPSTAVPTTAVPTTAVPTTAPTTAAPTTAAPTTAVPEELVP